MTTSPESTPPTTAPAATVEKPIRKNNIYEAITKRLDEIEAKLADKEQFHVQAPANTDLPTPKPQAPNLHTHEHETPGQPHIIGAWQRYCPTCGEANPDFKDEVICDTCGTHLGAKAVVEKLKACPNCGGKKSHQI